MKDEELKNIFRESKKFILKRWNRGESLQKEILRRIEKNSRVRSFIYDFTMKLSPVHMKMAFSAMALVIVFVILVSTGGKKEVPDESYKEIFNDYADAVDYEIDINSEYYDEKSEAVSETASENKTVSVASNKKQKEDTINFKDDLQAIFYVYENLL